MNKRALKLRLKNSIGRRTKRKLLAFYVDDWGSVRTRDRAALDHMRSKGLDIDNSPNSRFTLYDTLASEEDLSALLGTLDAFRGSNGRPVCFTLVMNPANPDFDRIKASGFSEFYSEPFTATLKRYGKGFEGSFDLWEEGISEKFFHPIFHGTEHVSRKAWLKSLQDGNKATLASFECESVGVPGENSSLLQPYYIESASDNEALKAQIAEGTALFENLFGFRARQFRAGGDIISPDLYSTLAKEGIEYMDETLSVTRHLGDGRYKRYFNYLGKRNGEGQGLIIRNCIFEPSSRLCPDWVGNVIQEIGAAFACGKPAIISSHRVNYVGSLDPQNRKEGLGRLNELLATIVKRYPDVEFLNGDEIGDIFYKP